VAREQVWPVLSGVAEWIASRVDRTSRGYEIRRALGVAERPQPGDNSAFVNVGAIRVLRQAAELAEQLDLPVPPEWRPIADGLVLPIDDEGVLLDHDDFDPNEEKAATPAAAAALTLFGSPVAADVASATRRCSLDRAKEYLGSPMLSSLFGAWAAQEGDRQRSIELFEEGYAAFCSKRFANVHEYRSDVFPDEPVAGPFYANLAGSLLACLFGLSRIRLGTGAPASWCEEGPLVMPDGWDGIEVQRVWAQGRAHRLIARHGDPRAQLEPLDT
jgi:hypothetical protein